MVVWHWNHYLVEFIGTFCLTFTIGCAVNIRSPDVTETGLAIGLALTLLVYSGGYISGAHYNPAVSIAVWIRGKLVLLDLIVYIVIQLLAGFIAALVVFALFGQTFAFPGPTIPPLFTVWRALTVEFIFTFILTNSVLHTGTKQANLYQRTEGNNFFGLTIGSSLLTAVLTIGGVSGACLNPAVGNGYALVQAIVGTVGSVNAAGYVWIYWISPMIGGLCAALFFKVTAGKDNDQVESIT